MSVTSGNLLQLKNGVKNFGARTLFSGASFSVNVGEKIGVIGPNGAGKSTLFRILVGHDSLDQGEITRASGMTLGYLAQEDHGEEGQTVEDYLVQQKLTPLWEIKSWAPRFGLTNEMFARPIKSLSGGYRMRVKLLKLLASKPDLMLLDEPTNYLDLETLVVLENFLLEASCSFLLISHDREFLRRTTDHILEIEAGEMTKYPGNIDDYFEQKELLREQLQKAAASQQAKRKEILDFAAKYGAKATKARQVQSRLKRLSKMEEIEVKALPLEAKIRLPEPPRTGRLVARAESARLGYGERTILRSLNLEIEKGDRIGVVGMNGAGKSTLLKAIAGELAPLEGSVKLGDGIRVAFFAQHVAERLNPDDTVLEAMGEFASADVSKQSILDLAGSLLFGGDDVDKKIRVLSGGEKSRVALGQILLKRASLLILDEPTNHLDFHTVEALTQALAAYEGAFVVVSHDRGFVRRAASKILEVRDGHAALYPGTYDEYVWSVQKGALSNREESAEPARLKADEILVERPIRDEKFNFKERKKSLEREIRAREKEMSTIDTDVERLKEEMLKTNELLASNIGSPVELAKQIGQMQAKIDELDQAYLVALERHEEAERELDLIEKRRTD